MKETLYVCPYTEKCIMLSESHCSHHGLHKRDNLGRSGCHTSCFFMKKQKWKQKQCIEVEVEYTIPQTPS